MTLAPNPVDVDRFASEVRRVDKPWGYEVIFAHTESYCGKILFVRVGQQLSLQYHREKDETIYVQDGRIELEVGAPGMGTKREVVGAGRAFRLRPGTVHRCRALEDSVVLETSTPHLGDVVRLEDAYGRTDRRAE